MTIGVAVLGTGRLGGRYIETVKNTPGAKMIVVAEPRGDAAEKWKTEHPDVEFVSDYRDILKRGDVQVVVGTLPHWLHKQAAIDAANAGKHIYMEKPMAAWLSEANEMVAAAKKNNVRLMTAHTQRYYPAVKAMKQIVDSKRFGDLIMVHDMWHKPYDPYIRPEWMLDRKRGGGMGQMDGSHEIDRLLWILGPDVVSVSAMVGQITHPKSKHPKINCDDTSMAFLRWKSGLVATISRIAWDKGGTEYGADYFFTEGMARFRIQYGQKGPKTGIQIADTHDGEWKSEPVPETDSMADEFADFIKAIERGDTDTPVPMEHGRNVLRVLEATEESSRLGREVRLD